MTQVLVFRGSRHADVGYGFLGLALFAGGLALWIFAPTFATGDDRGVQILIACGMVVSGTYMATTSFSEASAETRDPVLVVDAEGICVSGRCVPWNQVQRIEEARIADSEGSGSIYQLRVSCRGAASPLESSRFPAQPYQPPLPKVLTWVGNLGGFRKRPTAETVSSRDKMSLSLHGLSMDRDQIIKAVAVYYGGSIEKTRARSLKY